MRHAGTHRGVKIFNAIAQKNSSVGSSVQQQMHAETCFAVVRRCTHRCIQIMITRTFYTRISYRRSSINDRNMKIIANDQ